MSKRKVSESSPSPISSQSSQLLQVQQDAEGGTTLQREKRQNRASLVRDDGTIINIFHFHRFFLFSKE